MSKRIVGPWFVGHRGAMGHAPENTLVSFKTAWRMGADAVECDVHMTKDRRLIVIHDGTLERTTNGAGRVFDHPWKQLRSLDAGKWFHPRFRGEKIRRLEELLSWLRPKKSRAGRPMRIFIELKSKPVRYPGLAEAVARAVRRGGFLQRATVISFDHDLVRRVKAASPRLQTGILFSEPLADPVSRARRVRADGLFPRYPLVNKALVDSAHRRGLLVGAWTVNEKADMLRMARLGVDAVTSNFPDRLIRVLRRK
ncbi:MAG TPA: glycerophosphodiester phosphodiesterase family protein [Elusimicrobiota bacterium]|nr:glycerophosphodiester phosphodiesterase family protein [Elusimicrobiota bacterium]